MAFVAVPYFNRTPDESINFNTDFGIRLCNKSFLWRLCSVPRRYGKTAFDVTLLVLEDDGAVLTSSLAAASLALADAKVNPSRSPQKCNKK